MSKFMKSTFLTAAAMAAIVTAAPVAAVAQQSNGVTSCDAPGGRQQAGAVIGGLLGAAVGSQVARNERGIGALVGAGAGAAAGSYIGCNQQRGRAASQGYGQASAESYRASSNLRVRSGPGTNYRQVGSVSAGQNLQLTSSSGEWVQLSNGGWVNANYVSRY